MPFLTGEDHVSFSLANGFRTGLTSGSNTLGPGNRYIPEGPEKTMIPHKPIDSENRTLFDNSDLKQLSYSGHFT
jgi:hypothetical protein